MRGELFEWLDALLDAPLPEGSLGVRAAATAVFVLWYHDVATAQEIAERALEPTASGSGPERALALLGLGKARAISDPDSAARLLEQAEAEFREHGDNWHAAMSLQIKGSADRDHERALGQLARAAELFGRLHDDVSHANCLNQMASLATDAGTHPEDADAWIAEARRLAEATGNHHELLHADVYQARLDARLGRDRTHRSLNLLLSEFRRLGDRRCMSRSLLLLGEQALASDDRVVARGHLVECVRSSVEVGHNVGLAWALRLLAGIEANEGNPLRAAVMIGAADAAATHIDPARRAGLPPDGDLRAELRRALGEVGFAQGLTEGRQIPAITLIEA